MERVQFLFVEKYGQLFGFNLSGDGGSYSQISSMSGGFSCLLDLFRYGYPLGMCHVKINDKHYLMGGIRRNLEEYSDDVFELDTDRCRIRSVTIRDPKHFLKPAGTRIKDPKFAKAFNLKGKHYLLHAQLIGHGPVEISVPFERLDVAADAEAAAPPFSCHKVPIVSWYKVPTRYDNPFDASNRFIIDDKLVLFFDYKEEIRIFTPPPYDDDSPGKWSRLGSNGYNDARESFLNFVPHIPSTGIFLSSESRILDPDLGVLLTFDHEVTYGEGGGNIECRDVMWAFVISTTTYEPRYFQRLDVELSESIPPNVWRRDNFLQDLGIGDQGSKRICAITVATDSVDGGTLTYVSVSQLDVKLIEHSPDPSPFLEVLTPLKTHSFRVNLDRKWPLSCHVCNAFIV